MATYSRIEEIPVWLKARELDKKIFETATEILEKRDFGLYRQILNASGSVMDNIAEGFGRGSRLEFINFLSYSKGSAVEVKSQLYRSLDRGYLEKEYFETLYTEVEEIIRSLAGFIDYLNKSEHKGLKFKNRI